MTEQHGDPNEYDHWGYKDYLITKPLQRPLRPERTRPPRPLGGNYQETQETTTTTTRPSKINRRPPGNLREIRIRPKHHDQCPFLARCTIVTTNVSPCTGGIQRRDQHVSSRYWRGSDMSSLNDQCGTTRASRHATSRKPAGNLTSTSSHHAIPATSGESPFSGNSLRIWPIWQMKYQD